MNKMTKKEIDCDKIYVVFSPQMWTSGDEKGANHAEIDGASKTLCGKSTIGWDGTGLGLENVSCIICRKKLMKMGCIK